MGYRKKVFSFGSRPCYPSVRPPETIPWLGERGRTGRIVGEVYPRSGKLVTDVVSQPSSPSALSQVFPKSCRKASIFFLYRSLLTSYSETLTSCGRGCVFWAVSSGGNMASLGCAFVAAVLCSTTTDFLDGSPGWTSGSGSLR